METAAVIERILRTLILIFAVYGLIAYVILPFFWRHYEHQPAFESMPKTARTAEGIPADPVNVGVVGTRQELISAMERAGWYPAEPITFKTRFKVAEKVLLNRPYPAAPVSRLYLWRRKEDLAFEQPAAASPRKRHHVRFWLSGAQGGDGRPLWVGAATFDRAVGLNRFTAQVTHHIFPDVDRERDKLIDDLKNAGVLSQVYQVTGTGPVLLARNGEGDRYFTDGELNVGVLAAGAAPRKEPPQVLPNPGAVEFKNTVWKKIKPLLGERNVRRP